MRSSTWRSTRSTVSALKRKNLEGLNHRLKYRLMQFLQTRFGLEYSRYGPWIIDNHQDIYLVSTIQPNTLTQIPWQGFYLDPAICSKVSIIGYSDRCVLLKSYVWYALNLYFHEGT